jgi:hypothetical protein
VHTCHRDTIFIFSLRADLMYATIDAVGPDKPMERNHSPFAGLYFVAIQVVCHFFMLEIFTGVIIDNFSKMKSLHHVRVPTSVIVSLLVLLPSGRVCCDGKLFVLAASAVTSLSLKPQSRWCWVRCFPLTLVPPPLSLSLSFSPLSPLPLTHVLVRQGSALLSRVQTMWVESLQFVYRVTPGVVVDADNIHPWRLKLRALVSSNQFEVGHTVVTACGDVLALGTPHFAV